MKLRFTAEIEVDIQDSWLDECWSEANLTTKETQLQDALSCAVDTIRERIGRSPWYDPVTIRAADIRQAETTSTHHSS